MVQSFDMENIDKFYDLFVSELINQFIIITVAL